MTWFDIQHISTYYSSHMHVLEKKSKRRIQIGVSAEVVRKQTFLVLKSLNIILDKFQYVHTSSR